MSIHRTRVPLAGRIALLEGSDHALSDFDDQLPEVVAAAREHDVHEIVERRHDAHVDHRHVDFGRLEHRRNQQRLLHHLPFGHLPPQLRWTGFPAELVPPGNAAAAKGVAASLKVNAALRNEFGGHAVKSK